MLAVANARVRRRSQPSMRPSDRHRPSPHLLACCRSPSSFICPLFVPLTPLAVSKDLRWPLPLKYQCHYSPRSLLGTLRDSGAHRFSQSSFPGVPVLPHLFPLHSVAHSSCPLASSIPTRLCLSPRIMFLFASLPLRAAPLPPRAPFCLSGLSLLLTPLLLPPQSFLPPPFLLLLVSSTANVSPDATHVWFSK
eukprot:3728103-Pleurochrysis_carterae.AAC.3